MFMKSIYDRKGIRKGCIFFPPSYCISSFGAGQVQSQVYRTKRKGKWGKNIEQEEKKKKRKGKCVITLWLLREGESRGANGKTQKTFRIQTLAQLQTRGALALQAAQPDGSSKSRRIGLTQLWCNTSLASEQVCVGFAWSAQWPKPKPQGSFSIFRRMRWIFWSARMNRMMMPVQCNAWFRSNA